MMAWTHQNPLRGCQFFPCGTTLLPESGVKQPAVFRWRVTGPVPLPRSSGHARCFIDIIHRFSSGVIEVKSGRIQQKKTNKKYSTYSDLCWSHWTENPLSTFLLFPNRHDNNINHSCFPSIKCVQSCNLLKVCLAVLNHFVIYYCYCVIRIY